MRILLINNASGVHEYLRRGLVELGHETLLVMPGVPNYQGRSADQYFGIEGTSLVSKFRRLTEPASKLRALGRFDVANYQLGLSLFNGRFNRYSDLHTLKSSGTKLSYYALGCDEASLLRVRDDVDALPCCNGCLEYDAIGKSCAKQQLGRRPQAQEYASLFDVAVSAAYIYDHGMNFFPTAVKDRIPFPIDLRELEFTPASGKKKRPLIIHSPTRGGFKGTSSVLEALKILAQRRSDFEFRVIQGLSHVEYIDAMRDCDIYVDQVLSGDSFGVAALENMACGKIVVSGNGPTSWTEYSFMRKAPVVRAAWESGLLADTLSDILDRRADFDVVAHQGRDYVSQNHSHVEVASRFLALWSGKDGKSIGSNVLPYFGDDRLDSKNSRKELKEVARD